MHISKYRKGEDRFGGPDTSSCIEKRLRELVGDVERVEDGSRLESQGRFLRIYVLVQPHYYINISVGEGRGKGDTYFEKAS